MEGGGSNIYGNSVGELGLEAANIRQSKISTDGSSNGIVIGNRQSSLLQKRKRGRPRKYDADGNFIRRPSEQLSSSLQRGRQPQRSTHHLHAMGKDMYVDTTGMELTPYVIQVHSGEDIAEKIIATFQTGPRCISVLSAIGAVHNVVIRQPDSSSYAHLLKYEGIFEILRLSGTFKISEDGTFLTGNLSVLLSRTDGYIIGGTLGGSLLAATPVQMVVGSFIPPGKQKQPKKRNQYELRIPVVPHVDRDPNVGVSKIPISQTLPINKRQVRLHESTPIPGRETNDGGTSYTKHKARTSSLSPSWNLKPSPDLNIDASMESF